MVDLRNNEMIELYEKFKDTNSLDVALDLYEEMNDYCLNKMCRNCVLRTSTWHEGFNCKLTYFSRKMKYIFGYDWVRSKEKRGV